MKRIIAIVLFLLVAVLGNAQVRRSNAQSGKVGSSQRQQTQQRREWKQVGYGFGIWDPGMDEALGGGTAINREQGQALVTGIEARTGIKGDIVQVTAVNGADLGPGSDMKSILIVAQKNPSGAPTTLLAFVSGEYVDYKFHPVVKFIDTKALPPLLELHFSKTEGREKGEELTRVVVSRAWTTDGIIRKRAGVIGFRDGSASIVEDLGTVIVDSCQANPNGYKVSASAGIQWTEYYTEKRRYYEHTVKPCSAGKPQFKFQSPLDADAAYEWAINGGVDVLR